MQLLSPLSEIVTELEQHEKSARIKKLLVCACKDIWESDPQKLESFPLENLIQELWELNPTVEKLSVCLGRVVKSLNKRKEYAAIANIIITQMGQLYPDSQESTVIISIPTHPTASTAPLYPDQQTPNDRQPENRDRQNEYRCRDYNPFDLRLELMKYTNPMMAKILLFSALDRQFTFKREDWLTIRGQELDDLLLRIFRKYEMLDILQEQLVKTSERLKYQEESTQAASAIIRILKPFYHQGKRAISPPQEINEHPEIPTEAIANHDDETRLLSDAVGEEDDSEFTAQIFPF